MSFKIPWKRYAKLFKIIDFFSNESKEVEKRQLNDLLFLVGRDEQCLKYDFTFYSHGIYSDQLENDLEVLENFGAITMKEHACRNIKILNMPSLLAQKANLDDSTHLSTRLDKIKTLIEDKSYKELELLSALFFISSEVEDKPKQEELLREIKLNVQDETLESLFSWFSTIQKTLETNIIPTPKVQTA